MLQPASPRPDLGVITSYSIHYTKLYEQTAGQALDSRWPEAEDGTDVALVGWIDATPRVESERTVFSMRVADAESPHPPRRVRLSWYAPVPSLEAGQGLQIVARLRAPRGLVNPGTFDYERWLLLEVV